MRIQTRKGFSIIEVLLSMAIFAFIMAGLNTTLFAGKASWQMQDAIVQAQQQVRLSIETLKRDLRVAQNLVINQEVDNVTVAFTSPTDGNVTYSWTTELSADMNRILRTTDSGTRIVARDVSAFSLTDSGDDVTVSVRASVQTPQSQNVDFELAGRVAKR